MAVAVWGGASGAAHAGHGCDQRYTGQFFLGKFLSGYAIGHRSGSGDAASGRRLARHRRGIHASGCRSGKRGRGNGPSDACDRGLRGKLRIPISLDTQKASVAEAGIGAGVQIINDISALRFDPSLGEVVRRTKVGLVLMHMRGTPSTMQEGPFAREVLSDVSTGLRAAAGRATRAGIAKSRIVLDPGIGFGKRYGQNFEILARLPELAKLDFPLLAGTSRKTFLGWALAKRDALGKLEELPWPAENRLWGTAATLTASILGGAHIVRVHDVAEMIQVVRVSDAIAEKR